MFRTIHRPQQATQSQMSDRESYVRALADYVEWSGLDEDRLAALLKDRARK